MRITDRLTWMINLKENLKSHVSVGAESAVANNE